MKRNLGESIYFFNKGKMIIVGCRRGVRSDWMSF